MARWTQTARLSNPASTIRPDDVKLTILVDGKEVSGSEIRLEYQLKDGKQVEPTFQVSMTNNSARTLYCGLLDLTQRFRVFAGLIKPAASSWSRARRPGATWASRSRRPFPTRSGSRASSSTRTCSS